MARPAVVAVGLAVIGFATAAICKPQELPAPGAAVFNQTSADLIFYVQQQAGTGPWTEHSLKAKKNFVIALEGPEGVLKLVTSHPGDDTAEDSVTERHYKIRRQGRYAIRFENGDYRLFKVKLP